jgi:NSS family neurotransmitter:Na+ symporter
MGDEMPEERMRWHSDVFFYMAALGSSIGIGNIWKFPALTWKHGGPAFVIGYLIVMIIVGVPMLVLELTLG